MTPRFTPNPLVAALALSFATLSSGSAYAMETLNAQDVVVTASRVEKALADVNMSVSVIDRETIERNAQAKTIADLLESTVPGIRIQNDGGQGIDRVSIRGEDAFRTVVMVDGQRISEQKSMSGVPLLIDPSQVERIEVIRGPASVLYGSDAIGGAINIITKKEAIRLLVVALLLALIPLLTVKIWPLPSKVLSMVGTTDWVPRQRITATWIRPQARWPIPSLVQSRPMPFCPMTSIPIRPSVCL